MGNRATPSRSFNTVKHSNRDKRIKRQRQERVVLLSICLVVVAILLSLLVFLVCMIVDTVKDGKDDQPNNGFTPPVGQQGTQDIIYMQETRLPEHVHTGELLIVNSQNQYHFPTTATGLKPIAENRVKYEGVSNTYMVKTDVVWKLKTDALSALNDMMYKYYEVYQDGSVMVTSAYRSYEYQDQNNFSTPAGYSDHHTGLCVALQGNAGKGTSVDAWFYENCHKYGFVVRYPDDKSTVTGVSGYEYCFRYVGVAHATYMSEKSLCLEEYVEQLKSTYTINNHLKITGADGKNYEVYYVPVATTELTTLQVPKNYQYTISGDNIGGFIVTVCLDEPVSA